MGSGPGRIGDSAPSGMWKRESGLELGLGLWICVFLSRAGLD